MIRKRIAIMGLVSVLACVTACSGGKQTKPAAEEAVSTVQEAVEDETLSVLEEGEDLTMDGNAGSGQQTEDEAATDGTNDPAQEADDTEEIAGMIEESGQKTEPENTSAYENGQEIYLDSSWEFAGNSRINSGCAVMYTAFENRKNIIIGVNAGHGTSGGESQKTYCHPDQSPKTTGGTTSAGSVTAVAVSGGMTFHDGTRESEVTLQMARILRDKLLAEGYDVLMIRDGEDVQLDNVARTVICNNVAACHIALHWDGDGLDYDKGCFYCSVPDGVKGMYPVSGIWEQDEALGSDLIEGLRGVGAKIRGDESMDIDLTQTSYSTIPSVDIELGNAASAHDQATLVNQADGLVDGINHFFAD